MTKEDVGQGDALHGQVVECIHDMNGNHVIQKVVDPWLGENWNQFGRSIAWAGREGTAGYVVFFCACKTTSRTRWTDWNTEVCVIFVNRRPSPAKCCQTLGN